MESCKRAMGDPPNPASRHESSAEPARGELSRALDRAEHRRLEQRILADRALAEAARRPTDAGLGVEILKDIPAESSPSTADRRRPLWMALAAASVIAPCALVIVLSRATADAPAAATPVAALPHLSNREADPLADLPEPPPIESLPVVAAAASAPEPSASVTDPKPRAPTRPRSSATNDVAPNGDKPFFEPKRQSHEREQP